MSWLRIGEKVDKLKKLENELDEVGFYCVSYIYFFLFLGGKASRCPRKGARPMGDARPMGEAIGQQTGRPIQATTSFSRGKKSKRIQRIDFFLRYRHD
jgi:hypothetical protein